MRRCDVAIVGGGIVGLATAYFLRTLEPAMRIAVVEREPGYEHCSTLRASGGCRVLFSCPENIAMSLFSIAAAHRFPALEAAKCHRTWAGLYEQCELDGNPIIGNWPGRLENFHVCAGFSGHGMMHAPAAGRAVAERIAFGADRSIDLSRLGYQRVLDGQPYAERGIL